MDFLLFFFFKEIRIEMNQLVHIYLLSPEQNKKVAKVQQKEAVVKLEQKSQDNSHHCYKPY